MSIIVKYIFCTNLFSVKSFLPSMVNLPVLLVLVAAGKFYTLESNSSEPISPGKIDK